MKKINEHGKIEYKNPFTQANIARFVVGASSRYTDFQIRKSVILYWILKIPRWILQIFVCIYSIGTGITTIIIVLVAIIIAERPVGRLKTSRGNDYWSCARSR